MGQDIAIYKWVQLWEKEATPGNKMTPIDQNCSNKVITTVLYVPPVISETETENYISKIYLENDRRETLTNHTSSGVHLGTAYS